MTRSEALKLIPAALWTVGVVLTVLTKSPVVFTCSLVLWLGLVVLAVRHGGGIRWPSKDPDDYVRRR